MATRPAAPIRRARLLYAMAAATSGIPVHPLTFKPEFIDAYELGTKNTLLDGGLTLNGDVFFYNYTGYQISEIVDRTSINLNFNATVKGAELEATYEPLPGLKFNFAGGYEDTRIDNGQSVRRSDGSHGGPSRLDAGQAVRHAAVELHFAGLCRGSDDYDGRGRGEGNPIVSACGAAYHTAMDPVVQGCYSASWAEP